MAASKISKGIATTDEQLMKLITQGDRNAFELLYERYFEKLVWFAQGFVNDKHKAEDIVQEVFIKIIEKPKSFDSSQTFSTWVYTLTGNASKSKLRDEQNRARLLDLNLESSTFENKHNTLDQKILKGKIESVFKELSEKEKNIFRLRFEEEFSIKEISKIAGIPEGSVKSGIYYMLKKFANHLKEFAHGK